MEQGYQLGGVGKEDGMSWVKIDDALPRHEKFASLSDGALALWLKANCWCHEKLNQVTCGFVPERKVIELCGGSKAKAKRLARELVEARGEEHYGHEHGLWHEENGGWRFHDWGDYRPESTQTPEQQDDLREKRSAAGKRGAKARWGNSKPGSKVAIPTDSKPDGKTDSNSDGITDPVTRYPLPVATTATAAADPEPRNMAEALKLPIQERSEYVEGHRHTADWLEPQRWPEVLEIAAAHHVAQGFTNTPRLLSYASDEGVKRLVQLFAAGFSVAELKTAVSSSWWRSEKRSLRQLSPTIVERSLAGSSGSPEDAAAERRRIAKARQAELDARAAAEAVTA